MQTEQPNLSTPSRMPNGVESIVEIAWRRKAWVAGVLFITLMAAALALILLPKRIAAEGRVVLNRTATPGVETTNDELRTFLNTQAELIKSATVLAPALDGPKVDQCTFFEGAASQINLLKDHLEVTPLPDSSILRVRLKTTNKEEARLIVDSVVKAYVEHVAAQKKNVAIDVFDKLAGDRQRLENDRLDAKRLVSRLESETRTHIAKDGNGATNLAVQKVRQLSDDVIKAQLETAAVKAQFEDSLKVLGWTPDKIDEKKLASATAASAQNLPVLQANMATLSKQLVEAKRQFVPTHPAVRTIQKQIKDMQLTLTATLRTMVTQASNKEAAVRKSLLEQASLVENLDAKAAEMESIRGRVAMLDKQISLIDEKLGQLRLTETVGFTASEVEPAAVDETSVSPNTWRALGMAAIVGLVLGLVSALVREWVSPAIGAVHRIADAVGIPVLGTLPRLAGETVRNLATITHSSPESQPAESFRSIRTSLLFGSGRCNTIAVTSPAARDGKTTLASNLAISLAQSGKRVVLVDVNFREPNLHNIFKMDNAIGFTGVMNGEDLESSLRRTEIEHLDVLTAGPKMPEISEQLNSRRFGDLLRDLNLRYDHVIFDSGSANGNDARVIAASCDQTILVVRGERANRFAATVARDALLSVGASLMGIVVNDAQSPAQAYPPAGERREQIAARSNELAERMRSRR